MPETESPKFEDLDAARAYVDRVRELYRDDQGEYAGRRNEEQQMIAEFTSEEARLLVDSAAAGVLALGGASMPENYDEITFGYHTWDDFRTEFSRLLVGFGVLTNRLERDKLISGSYANFRAPDRAKLASVLFTDFLKHNALRFGADTAGLRGDRRVSRHTDDGGISLEFETYSKDKARNDKELQANMRERGYAAYPAAHAAAKMSPDEAIRLRRAYPEMDKSLFDFYISNYRDAEKELEKRE